MTNKSGKFVGKYLSIGFVLTVFRFFFGFRETLREIQGRPDERRKQRKIDWKRFKINNRKNEP